MLSGRHASRPEQGCQRSLKSTNRLDCDAWPSVPDYQLLLSEVGRLPALRSLDFPQLFSPMRTSRSSHSILVYSIGLKL